MIQRMTRIKKFIVSLQADLQKIPTSSSLSLNERVRPQNTFIDLSMTVVNHLKFINHIDRYRQFGCKQTPGSGVIKIIFGNTDK